MPTLPLPDHASADALSQRVTALLAGHASGDLAACQRLREFFPAFQGFDDRGVSTTALRRDDCELTIAREYGFLSWSALLRHVERGDSSLLRVPHHERIADPTFRAAVGAVDRGDIGLLQGLLADHPELREQQVVFEGTNYFREPSLLEFVAENPSRHGKLPPNIVAVAKTILDDGPAIPQRFRDSTLELVSSSAVARECGVQRSLIDLLIQRGADPNCAMLAPLLYGEFNAVRHLVDSGARLTLPAAAAMGLLDAAGQLFAAAGYDERQIALALAAQHGHAEVVALLLDHGADPNRYTPVGGHSHATPLHQAAFAGHEAIVRLLLARGARTDIKDIHYDGTPLEWANYAHQTATAKLLHDAG